MKIVRILPLLLFAVPAFVSCRKTDPELADSSGLIFFQVAPDTPVSKSMISNPTDLINACTPSSEPGGGGLSIGLWAAMEKNGETTNDVFQGVNLQWRAVGEKGHENNPSTDETSTPSYWNTFIEESGVVKHAEVYWHPGETYYFRAYYPAGVELANNTSASTFIAEYHTNEQQDDLMAAYTKKVLTNKAQLQEHVQLNLLHMLSAVEFKFRFKEESGFEKSDELVSVWLENTASGQFGNYGLLVFGDGKPESDPTANPRKIEWYIINTPAEGAKMYYWEHESGVPFYRNTTENVAAVAYSDPEHTAQGTLYAGNSRVDGSSMVHNYVYMIPQDLHTGTQICFTTVNSAGHVFRVDLPDHFYDDATPTPIEHTSLEPGYRYTFNIVISRLDIEAFITIREWNLLESSYTIDF